MIVISDLRPGPVFFQLKVHGDMAMLEFIADRLTDMPDLNLIDICQSEKGILQLRAYRKDKVDSEWNDQEGEALASAIFSLYTDFQPASPSSL